MSKIVRSKDITLTIYSAGLSKVWARGKLNLWAP